MMDMPAVEIVEPLCIPFEEADGFDPSGTYVKIEMKDDKFGGMKMTWLDLPRTNGLGPKSFWVAYEKIDKETFLAETREATTLPSDLPGHAGAESIFWKEAGYTDASGNLIARGEATLPPNLFFKMFVSNRTGFYRINEMGSWNRDGWGSLKMASILNGIECMLRHENGRAEGWLKPSPIENAY